MRNRLCPECGNDISHSYVAYDPAVGVFAGGWFCEACNLAIEEKPYNDDDAHEIYT